MQKTQQILDKLKPTEKPNVMELVAEAGFDISDWPNYKNGRTKPAANPKYCYRWSFFQDDLFIFNIWFEEMKINGDKIFQHQNVRADIKDLTGAQKGRARSFDSAVRTAFLLDAHPRVIILDRKEGGKSAVGRRLDTAHWTVTQYDNKTGAFEICRGIHSPSRENLIEEDAESFLEGELRLRLVRHRTREAKLRERKIANHKAQNCGRLVCEVDGCGFDFEAVYGDLGRDYAQVHHRQPLNQADEIGINTTLDDLAVVCANCHVMIHRGGECRDLEALKLGSRSDV